MIGLASSIYTRRLRIGLACGVGVCAILALGHGSHRRRLPLPAALRLRPRVGTACACPDACSRLATLFLALLAAAGAWRIAELVRAWGSGYGARGAARLVAVVGALLVVGVVGEGAGHLGHPVVPQPARAEIGLKGPLIDLPTDGAADRLWQYFSTNGFYKIPLGNSTFDIPATDDLRGGMSGFPDRASIEKLRYYGVKTVVLHLRCPRCPGIKLPGDPRAARPARRRRQAGHRARCHAPPGGVACDLRNRAWPEVAARNRLVRCTSTSPKT